MQNLKKTLKNRLKGAEKLAVLGVGSELRGDDAAGVLVVKQLERFCGRSSALERIKVFNGATSPENLTGEIKRFKPTHLLIVDSSDSGKNPGSITLIEPEKISGISFSTHRLPMKILNEYLRKSINCDTIFIGIEAKSVDFCASVSKEVKAAAGLISDTIKEIMLDREDSIC